MFSIIIMCGVMMIAIGIVGMVLFSCNEQPECAVLCGAVAIIATILIGGMGMYHDLTEPEHETTYEMVYGKDNY